MSWQSLIKPPGKDPKNINEWLALITEKIRELKQTENWYDVSRVVMTTSIVDNLESHRDDAILSANQGRTLKELIDTLETKVDDLVEGLNTDISEINGLLDENIPKLNSSIESIAQLTTRLNQLSGDVSKNSEDIETINNTLIELTNDISDLENSLNVISDRINKNNETITNRVSTLETKIDQNLEKINEEIADISNDMGVLVGGNEILSGLNINISSENVITTSVGKVLIKGEVIDINTQLSITVTPEMLNRDYILLITLKLNDDKEPILALVETVSSNEVLIAKLSIIDGVINSNSKMNELQPINTMIGLAADNEADTVRETIPSGFTTLGGLDYEYMLNNENVVKLKSESVAYVNGYKVVIPKDTVVNIGKAPEKESREDLLFLEVWKDEDFTKSGKVKWRIRHEINVDFDSNYDGLSWSSWYYKSLTFAQGGNPSPVCKSTDTHRVGNEHAHFKNGKGINEIETATINFMITNFNDPGLFVAGDGTQYYKELLKTIDGFSFAIPMFRMYRKPSCGKSIPFEYSKINPKVEYSKFIKLMKEEKVERVHTENIKGRSLVNLARRDKTFSLTLRTGDHYNSIKICDTCLLKHNTPYTLVYSINVLSDTTGNNLANLNHGGQFGLSTGGDDTTNHPSIIDSDKNGYSFDITNLTVKVCKTFIDFKGLSALTIRPILPPTRPITGTITYELCNLMLLEGDWSNKEIPEFFTGLKSLGEDDGNLITIKDGILDDNTYDVNDGNQKLTTFPNTTHILSDNVMIPKVEAVVKKGEQETPLEKLGTKLETDGTEIVEFTKIKGRTLQNIITNAEWIINSNKDTAYMIVDWSLLKPDTTYTYYIYNLSSKVNRTNGFVGANFTQPPDNDLSRPILINSVSNLEGVVGILHPHVYGTDFVSTDFTNTKIIILEGDYTNTPLEELPFVEGIKSVGETEDNKIVLNVTAKNIIPPLDDLRWWVRPSNMVNVGSEFVELKGNPSIHSLDNLIVIPNTNYVLSGYLTSDESHRVQVQFPNNNESNITTWVAKGTRFKISFNSLNNNKITIWLRGEKNVLARFENIQLEEEVTTDYEPYKEYKQDVYLKEPLRSLPNGVFDEIVGNKVIRRVGKIILDGSEPWNLSDTKALTLLFTSTISNIVVDKSGRRTPICNNLPCYSQSIVWTRDIEGVGYADLSSGHLRVRMLKSKLSSHDREGFKTWLSQNPTTVYYELLNPIEEYLENVYDKESIKTYQLDAPLRSLPNGVKDEIKDGVLIRRCEELIFDGSFSLGTDSYTDGVFKSFYYVPIKPIKSNSTYILCDLLPYAPSYGALKSNLVTNVGEGINFKLDTTNWIESNHTGLLEELKKRPLKVIYELATPIEIPLTEAKPQTVDFSLQRQFTEGNYLREVPNGVKDTVENGKVKRRVGKIVLNGSESWSINGVTSKFAGYKLTNVPIGSRSFSIISDKLPVVAMGTDTIKNPIGISATTHGVIRIRPIDKDDLTVEDVKAWLAQNPLTVLYELDTPTEEVLSTDNYMTYPYHDFNTFCGSMYLGEGRNYIINNNKLPSENPVIIETDFREVEGNTRVEDCRYKKCEGGYDTAYIGSNTINLVDLRSVPSNRIEGEYIKFNTKGNTSSMMFVGVYPIDGTPDYLSHPIKYTDMFTTREARKYRLLLGINGNVVDDKIWVELNLEPHTTYYKSAICEKLDENSCRFKNIIISKGNTLPTYTPHVPTTKYLENTEENDIEDLRHLVSLSGFNYDKILNESFDKLLRGEL